MPFFPLINFRLNSSNGAATATAAAIKCFVCSLFTFFFSLNLFAVHRPLDIKNRPRIPIPDEDPYSIAGNGDGSGGSSGSSGFGTSNNVSGVYDKNAFYSKFDNLIRYENNVINDGQIETISALA